MCEPDTGQVGPLRGGDRLQTIVEIGRAVGATLDLQLLYDTIYEQVSRIMDTAMFFIALHDRERGAIDLAYFRERGKLFLGQQVPYGRNVTSLVMDGGAPVLFNTLEQYLEFGRTRGLGDISVGEEDPAAMIFVPLNTGNRTIGALSTQSLTPYAYTNDDVQMLSIIASQAAIAIENARLFSEQMRRVFELQTIQSIVQNITPLHDAPSIAAVIARELRQLISYDSCRVFLLDDAGDLSGVSFPGAGDATEVQPDEGIVDWIAQHGSPALVPSTMGDARTRRSESGREEHSIMGAPLTFQGRVRGVVALTKRGRGEFDDNALRLLQIVSAQAAIALDRARLYQELRTEAITDPVTKLYNRRHLLERVKEERSRAARTGQSLIAIMVDIDKFKRVNDTFGHDAGDCVLQELARVIRREVRLEDLVARYGGEEFCILLTGARLEDALAIAERVRAGVEHHRLPDPAGVDRVTVSVGLAEVSPRDKGTEVFTRADWAMYRGKHLGGNRVCVDRPMDRERRRGRRSPA